MPPSQGAKIIKLNLVPPRLPEGVRPPGLEHMAGAGTEITFKFRAIPYIPIHERWTALITEFLVQRIFLRHPEAGPVQVVAPHPHLRGARSWMVARARSWAMKWSMKSASGWSARMLETMIFQRMMRSNFEHRKQALERVFAAEIQESLLAQK